MPIGPKILLRLVKEGKLVENLSERELQNPEGAGFDLRIGEIYQTKGKGFLGILERETPKATVMASYNERKIQKISLKPGEYYLMRTIETVNLPDDLIAYPQSRGTLHRSGVLLLCNQVNPGYCGQLTFGLANLGNNIMEIEMGARVAHIIFEKVEGGGSSYRGQWQGGRVAATKKEKQV
ncbi:hypothetical protein A2962_01855 [Candidatus Woesebacteria bacterium RIFCSPLOWO2_01_FULL_39_61]|uniref:Uncharacterized protein n=1 Tax=Candidatus Woesebacteria bacterium RIFCSPHIGHO2_02_FULL_39_13 TaxID=1802505 RepID=A0A1F7Z3Q0_9BACT|nr:MAG: hypothetical protein A2692_02855 [Candidatus Woesebacteria bacterium RIFCSPHIGHO2_01_FULL_39_95]OGM33729.1 MAG: hypothetical protein A3D01_06355 [Candidatus Woesebacteria bacterium RIFCSPHIGHO2_02_FULL_39_13]OGM38406.1 MAG: hypothetical protein A3E13_02040 [Candidatus Woesebacteria bacterium RIFCSPHIGHO2_12_FULL_40_20]OGM66773.1 MAG: hypothetical protein A2962_01855 [Candidatus Woesebacteria bacterium RIFCSPLOWO2_01_FULL_39_61]